MLARVLAYAQLGYVDATAFSTTRLKRNFHRCTLTALGVPVDPANGGLKAEGSADAPNPYLGAGGPHFDVMFFSANPPATGTDPEALPAARFAVRHRSGAAPLASALNGPDAAANLLVAGAFNLNSMDPVATAQRDRWRALLAAVGMLRFPGGVTPTLTSGDLDSLAAQFTAARLRAAYAGAPKNFNEPFRSVDGFARSGLLQSALDATTINAGRTPISPDYVSQDDLLALLAPILFVCSDTFVLRAYGEIRNPVLNVSQGQAWCEAVVQRVADYVDGRDLPGASPSILDNQIYGRRFIIVGFRWLTAADI